MTSRPSPVDPSSTGAAHLRFRPAAAAALTLTSLVGLASFTWPFFADPAFARERGQDAPWLFATLLGMLAFVMLAEVTAHGLDAKTVAVLGVLAAVGGALRVLSAGTAGLEPMFVVLVLGGRVLGRAMAFLLGALAMLAGAFLTAGIGPWLPFQMMAAGWVALGAACLPPARGRAELALLAGYGAATGLLYGAVMNLWFWPFLAAGSTLSGAGFVPGAPVSENLAHYAVFYVATSLGWDLPRAVITATVILLAGRPVLRALRRAVRKAAFG
ncbi:MAG: ECF transporter S component [Dermatophilaceae bacterium]